MKNGLRILLAALIIGPLFPHACFAGHKKQIWHKTVTQAGDTRRERHRTTIGRKSKCDIIIYRPATEDQLLIVNAYDKDRKGRAVIQEIKITKDRNGSAKKEDFRFRQECKGS